MMSEQVQCELSALREQGLEILLRTGVHHHLAVQVIDVLVDADACGVHTHGMTRLPSYVERIRRDLLKPNAEPTQVGGSGAIALLDARHGFGAVAGQRAVQVATRVAHDGGLAWVTTRNSNHFGMAGYYTRALAEDGLVAWIVTNAGASMAAHGGRRPVLGTNPVSIGVPGPNFPIVFDASMTNVARGKIRRAAAEGKTIPLGWALDAEGRPTTDAAEALQGMLVPLGAHKGYGLAAMFDLLSGVLGGGTFSTDVRSATDVSAPAGVSFSLCVLDPETLIDRYAFMARVQTFIDTVRASGDADDSVLLPGELEVQRRLRADRDGVSLPKDVVMGLRNL